MQGSRRGGVTWIVVVVVVVVLVLVGALASMQLLAAREANRRDLCINNLRNIALALIGHESTHGAYPGYANVIKDKRRLVAGVDASISRTRRHLSALAADTARGVAAAERFDWRETGHRG